MQKMRFNLLLVGCISFLVFLVFSFFVHIHALSSFDLFVTIWLQKIIPVSYDLFFSIFSFFGSFDVSCAFILILAGYLFLSRCRFGAFLSLFSFGLILGFELYGKLFIQHPSPPAVFARYIHFLTLPTDAFPHPSYSFPSGHSSRTVFLSTILLFLLLQKKKKLSKFSAYLLGFGMLFYDGLMLVSRIDLGEHWASDVIGGILLGVALGSFTVWGILKKD